MRNDLRRLEALPGERSERRAQRSDGHCRRNTLPRYVRHENEPDGSVRTKSKKSPPIFPADLDQAAHSNPLPDGGGSGSSRR